MTKKSGQKEWYVIKIATGYEGKLLKNLEELAKLKGLSHHFGEHLVPTEDVVDVKAGKKRVSSKRFFPGYLLMQIDMSDEVWRLIKSVPKIHGFVGGEQGRPAPIAEEEIKKIVELVNAGGDKPRPKVLYVLGEVVRIKEGPFSDFNAVVEDINYDKNRLRVSVSIFGRPTPVDLEFNQVEKNT